MKIPKGVHGSTVDDCFFTESSIPSLQVIKHLRIEIFHQNSNLAEIKKQLAAQAKDAGANAVINFHYGQKTRDWFAAIKTLTWDPEEWYGEGDAVHIK
jgi:uncharacterized protein YbjQ (UPF0145 family)